MQGRDLAAIGLAPQADLGAQAVVLGRRVEHLGLGGGEGRQQLLQAGLLRGELGDYDTLFERLLAGRGFEFTS